MTTTDEGGGIGGSPDFAFGGRREQVTLRSSPSLLRRLLYINSTLKTTQCRNSNLRQSFWRNISRLGLRLGLGAVFRNRSEEDFKQNGKIAGAPSPRRAIGD